MRIGIVGCGLIGRKRALAAAGHRIAIVADRVAEQAQALAAEAGGAQATTAWRDVIAADVDAVVVATPHNLLAEVTLAAVEAGKHVLVEKPAARTPAELEPVIAAAA